ncbi:hypothetical protein MAP00_002939 [Monascus purpureus]|nr:hypothetical protein MAP00_002939 [Monascus purpureus]
MACPHLYQGKTIYVSCVQETLYKGKPAQTACVLPCLCQRYFAYRRSFWPRQAIARLAGLCCLCGVKAQVQRTETVSTLCPARGGLCFDGLDLKRTASQTSGGFQSPSLTTPEQDQDQTVDLTANELSPNDTSSVFESPRSSKTPVVEHPHFKSAIQLEQGYSSPQVNMNMEYNTALSTLSSSLLAGSSHMPSDLVQEHHTVPVFPAASGPANSYTDLLEGLLFVPGSEEAVAMPFWSGSQTPLNMWVKLWIMLFKYSTELHKPMAR